MYGYGYSLYNRLSFLGSPLDPSAQAFFNATGITDLTIQGAVNSLVIDLKTFGLWSKMKAIYPFVGGTATTHSFNLVDTSLHQITWFGGLIHDANGVTPNGTNGYGNLNLNPRTHLGSTPSFGTYCRVNNTSSNKADFGSSNNDGFGHFAFLTSFGNTLYKHYVSTFTATNANTQGLFHFGYNASNNLFAYKNTTLLGTLTPPVLGTAPSENTAIFAYNAGGTANSFSPRPSSFFFAGNGLTDEDSANLYYSVQKFQTTLGRQVGTPIYSSNATDVNARLFLGATNIQDATITSAVDTLVQGLKTDGVWSKLKAVYPFVGGTATTHKFNLANALDEDTAFRLSFFGGWTHSANGATPNGTNAYANTFFNNNSNFISANRCGIGAYIRSNISDFGCDMGGGGSSLSGSNGCYIYSNFTGTYFGNANASVTTPGSATTDSRGFYCTSRNNSATEYSYYKRHSSGNITATNLTAIGTPTSNVILIGAGNAPVGNLSSRQTAFNFIHDGLSLAEVENLYTRVQAFQTTLNRQI